MITQTKAALVAALIVGSASSAFAVDVTRNANSAPSSYYVQAAPAPYASGPYAQALEGRGVPVQREYLNNGFQYDYPVQSDQKHWFERAPIDFNS